MVEKSILNERVTLSPYIVSNSISLGLSTSTAGDSSEHVEAVSPAFESKQSILNRLAVVKEQLYRWIPDVPAGREEEAQWLFDTIKNAIDSGKGSSVLVTGDHGQGKSITVTATLKRLEQ